MSWRIKKHSLQQDFVCHSWVDIAALLGRWFAIDVVLAITFYHDWIPLLFVVPTFPLYVSHVKKREGKKTQRQLRIQFRDMLQILEGWLQAGSSIERAMMQTEEELRLLLGKENEMVNVLTQMNRKITLNQTAEAVWRDFARESRLEEAENFAYIFGMVRRRGGKISEVSVHIVNQISMEIAVEEEIQTMIQGKKTEMQVMYIIPIGILLYLSWFNMEMVAVMYQTWIGRLIMTGCMVVYVGAWVLGDNMLGE